MDFKLFKIVKLNFLLNVFVTIGILFSPNKKSFVLMKSIKWYAYCHFKADGLSFDALSCGKCFHPYEPLNKLGKDQENDLIVIENDSSNNSYTNSTPRIISDTYISNVTVLNTTKRNHCDTFEDLVNKKNLFHYAINENDLNAQETFPLLPILTQNWFNFDLLYLIEKSEIVSNLKDFTLHSKIAENLRVIELNNFGIESIGRDAFKSFKNLRVLKLNNNRIGSIELSSFTPDEFDYDYDDFVFQNKSIKSRLVELDLSFNRLTNFKLENIQLENLRVLNFSHNFLKKFDLNFISAAVPKLKSLDLSYNLLRSFKVQESYVYFTDVYSSLSLFNQSVQSRQKFTIINNPILRQLTFLNLNGNYLNDFNSIFSLEFQYLSDTRFCNMSPFNIKPALILNNSQNINQSISQSLHLKLKNNTWKCDCKTFELLFSIVKQTSNLTLNENSSLNDIKQLKDSCYLNYFLKQNSFVKRNIIQNFYFITNLTCFIKTNINTKKNALNWSIWYNHNCLNLNMTYFSSSSTIPRLESSFPSTNKPAYSTYSISTNVTTSTNFNFDWLSTFYYSNSTRTNVYDVSSAFYWVSSVCLAVITMSCLFVAWFYCWRRYGNSRNSSASRRQRRRNLNGANVISSRRDGAQCPPLQGRNIHFFNARFNNPAFTNTEPTERINSHFVNNNPETSQGLYYIYRNSTANNFDQTDNMYNMNNIAYLSENLNEDQPPNYYEAVQIKNRIQQNIGKAPRTAPNLFGLTSNDNVVSRDSIELTARSSVSSRSSSVSGSEQNLAQNSVNETIISSSYDNEVIVTNNQLIQSNSTHSNQMTAYINISESGDESINSASQSSDV